MKVTFESMYIYRNKIQTKFWVALTKVFWFVMNGMSKSSSFGRITNFS